jgi:hypothetical protein
MHLPLSLQKFILERMKNSSRIDQTKQGSDDVIFFASSWRLLKDNPNEIYKEVRSAKSSIQVVLNLSPRKNMLFSIFVHYPFLYLIEVSFSNKQKTSHKKLGNFMLS